MIPVVSFIGKSSSGKTTFLEKVVRELKARGYRIAVVKHCPHGFEVDREGKDSWRLLEAGSRIVGVTSPKRVAFVEDVDQEPSLLQLQALFQGKADMLLTEGYKAGDAPKIIVEALEEVPTEALTFKGEALAIVSPESTLLGIPQFGATQVHGVVDLLVNRMKSETRHYTKLDALLAKCEALHGRICPGQVLGVRMALLGCRELGIEDLREESKRLVIYVEIDRCAADAIQVVTGCKLGKRTLKHVDYGKLAATFVDVSTGNAVRVAARANAKARATLWRRPEWTPHEAEVAAYKAMPDEDLFHVQTVVVQIPGEDMPGPPRRRVSCEECGEEVHDCREVIAAGKVLCRACAFGCYYDCSSVREEQHTLPQELAKEAM